MSKKLTLAVVIGLLLCGFTTTAQGQGLDMLGSRAAGLSAFVAVADDASAVGWNPAGLVAGPFFNISLDLGRSTTAPDGPVRPPDQAGRGASTLIAIGLPPLGLSYYRISLTGIDAVGPEVGDAPRRQDGQVVSRLVVTSHLGATLLQSLGDYVTIGTTVKLVRGSVGAGIATVASWDDAFERAEMVDTRASTRGDLDAGAMFAARRMRAGIVVRNVTEPTFGDLATTGVEATLKRHARVGVAWGDRWPGLARTIVSIDADLTRVPQAAATRRDLAAGVERWLRGQQIGFRGGVRASTIGDARPIVSGGVSYAVRSGTYVDAHIARGHRDHSAWGIAARLTY